MKGNGSLRVMDDRYSPGSHRSACATAERVALSQRLMVVSLLSAYPHTRTQVDGRVRGRVATVKDDDGYKLTSRDEAPIQSSRT